MVINHIVATVDGEPITAFELERFIRMNAGGVDPARLTEAERNKALDVLIGETLVRLESGRLGLSVSNDEVETYINEIKRSNKLDDAMLEQALAQQGFTLDGYRAQVRKELLKNQLVARQIRQKVTITPEDIQRYYDEHRDQWAHASAVHVRDIFFGFPAEPSQQAMKKVADRLRAAMEKLQAGTDFQKVAREYSDLPNDDLGWMKRGQMQPELEQVAFSLKKGQVSQPVQSPTGVHILKVDEIEAGSYTSLDEVRDQIQERLYAQAVQDRFQEWVEKDLLEGHAVVKRPLATIPSQAPDADAASSSDSGDQPG
jgi:peptidyl-prolyl cis-trans isomerase SurA